MKDGNEKYCANETGGLSGGEEKLFARIERAVLEEDVPQFEEKLERTFPRSKHRYMTSYKIAALLAVIVGLASVLYFNMAPKSQLFKEFYSPYPANKISGINRQAQEVANSGINFYLSGEYSKAIPGFTNLLKSEPSNYEAALLLAVSYIETKQYELGMEILSKIIDAPDNFFTDDAAWYKSLLFLKNGNYSAARSALSLIAPSSNYYSSSQELLEKIEKRDKKDKAGN